MTALATRDQVRAIQSARRTAGLRDDAAYRAALASFGVVSSRELTVAQAATFLDNLNGVQSPSERPASRRATGPFAKKLQALWLSAWNLGAVRERDDAALLAFVARQTGIAHTRFLRDPIEAAKAIEAVKAMLRRDGGVAWPKKPGPGAIELKRAVVAAQYRRLAAAGVYPEFAPFAHLAGPELDALAARLGREVRRPQPSGRP